MTSVEKPISQREIAARLRDYIAENFLMFAGVDHIGDSDSFLELGIIDSTGILELVGHVEATFGIHVEDDEMAPENLDSLDNLSAYIVRKSADGKRP